jgi:Na+/proline symporter
MMPFAGIFFAGVLWKRTTTQGVVACLVTACVICPLLMTNGQAHFLPFMEHALLRPWLHAAMLAFAVCMAVLVAVSLATPPAKPEKLRRTTISNWRALLTTDGTTAGRGYLLWLGALLAICSALWFAMR